MLLSKTVFPLQKGSLSQNMKDLLDIFGFVPHELDFLRTESISDNSYVNQAFSVETFLLKDHEMKIKRSQVDPLDVLTDHVKVDFSVKNGHKFINFEFFSPFKADT